MEEKLPGKIQQILKLNSDLKISFLTVFYLGRGHYPVIVFYLLVYDESTKLPEFEAIIPYQTLLLIK